MGCHFELDKLGLKMSLNTLGVSVYTHTYMCTGLHGCSVVSFFLFHFLAFIHLSPSFLSLIFFLFVQLNITIERIPGHSACETTCGVLSIEAISQLYREKEHHFPKCVEKRGETARAASWRSCLLIL